MMTDTQQFSADLLAALDRCELNYSARTDGLFCDRPQLRQSVACFRDTGKPAVDLIAAGKALTTNTDAWAQANAKPFLCRTNFEVLCDAAAVSGDASLRDFTCQVIDRILSAESWVAPMHSWCIYDHCRGNVAGMIAVALDLISHELSKAEVDDITNQLTGKFLEAFVDVWENQRDRWARRDFVENWKIMTCGDTGLAVLAVWDGTDLSRRALRACLEGVLHVLAVVPESGEYPEGVEYWIRTMGYGLRLGHALRHATRGQVDLFKHPRLQATGTFLLSHCQPDCTMYNWSDSPLEFRAAWVERFTLLGAGLKRGDILHVTRQLPMRSLGQILFDDPSVKSTTPTTTSALYERVGVSVHRDGWEENATFAGFKCGRANEGHSHMDQNSFVITRGRSHLAIDSGIWPYGHMLGYFDFRADVPPRRFNFDGVASFGHNTILVDGQGQEYSDPAGQIETYHSDDDLDYVVGQAGRCYGDRLTHFRRWFIWVKPDFFLVVDRLAADRLRHFEWIFQHHGELESAPADPIRQVPCKINRSTTPEYFTSFNTPFPPITPALRSVVRSQGQSLTIDMVYPPYHYGIRMNDVKRQTFYNENTFGMDVQPQVQYRSYSPLNFAEQMTFVVGMYLGDPDQITMQLVSDTMIRQGENPADAYYWPDEPIPPVALEFTIKGQPPRMIMLDEDNLTVSLD
jgi:hypothetical protein